jgi:ribosome-binding factor A
MSKRRSGRRDPRADNRMARVGELIRRILAESLDQLDDDRLEMVSITGVDVDRDLNRAVVWFTTLEGDDDADVLAAFDDHRGQLRRAVGDEARLRKTPDLQFRPDTALRAAERIEALIRDLDLGSDESGGG